ncbi:MAG: hypothetical protein JSR50_04445 [Proteobacteria bacterium]|nr:hypothetical protein [Pseudomonadota bacterium]
MPFLGNLRSKSISSKSVSPARARCGARATLATTLAALCIADANAGTTGSVALANDYVFRGVSQTNRKPAVQAGVEYDADNGLYAGTWGSNISWLSDLSTSAAPVSSSLETDLYGGYRHKLGANANLDVGVQYYGYPGTYPGGSIHPDTTELYAGVSIGVATLKYSRAASNLFGYARSKGSGYIDGAVNWEFSPGWTLNAHAGRQTVRHNAAYAYSDWKLGVTRTWKSGYSIAVAYVGTDADKALYTNSHGARIAGNSGVLTMAKSF